MDMRYAKPNAEGRFYRYCYVSKDGERERNLQPGEWLDDKIVPGAVRCDRFEIVPTRIGNARLCTFEPSLRTQGFELRRHDEALALPSFSHNDADAYGAWLQKELFPKTAALVRSATEKSFKPVAAVHVIDYTLRTTDGSGTNPRSIVMEAHTDFTPESGARRLQNENVVFKLGDASPISLKDEVLLVNLWQPLVDTVYRVPLAVCDLSSLSVADLVRKKMIFESREGEVCNVKQDDAQKWWYYKHMRKDEALIFLTWTPDGISTPHSAVEDSTDPSDAPPRRSMELRFVVKFAEPSPL
eukprot:CAMPEP_0117522148 /NCGR_PEP_ID=MMETSP0784-20121206/34057_1 /TAXON_ID=39447 /ORGANISM="" /LENGTH=298 /DNA_ID=CAMNT_0005318209 /DNA_START=63 /DNA_END=959 /DNA_ORIENTATION=+